MSYQIRPQYPIDSEIRRIVLEQIGFAKRRLNDNRVRQSDAIHKTRQAIKRARAAARLIRLVDRPIAIEVDRKLRNLGRLLSDARDRDVLMRTMTAVAQSAEDKAKDAERLCALVEYSTAAVQRERACMSEQLADRIVAFNDGVDELRARLRGISVGPVKRASVLQRVKRAYSRIRATLITAAASDDAVAYHECRKVVQRLVNQSWMIRQIDRDWFERRRPVLKCLARTLGYRQDLAVLDRWLERLSGQRGRVASGANIARRMIEARCKGIRREIAEAASGL